MDFRFIDEQEMIADTAYKIGEEFGLEYWREKDAKKEFSKEIWQAICDARFRDAAIILTP